MPNMDSELTTVVCDSWRGVERRQWKVGRSTSAVNSLKEIPLYNYMYSNNNNNNIGNINISQTFFSSTEVISVVFAVIQFCLNCVSLSPASRCVVSLCGRLLPAPCLTGFRKSRCPSRYALSRCPFLCRIQLQCSEI